jgi:hypothetical protein
VAVDYEFVVEPRVGLKLESSVEDLPYPCHRAPDTVPSDTEKTAWAKVSCYADILFFAASSEEKHDAAVMLYDGESSVLLLPPHKRVTEFLP